MSNNKLEKCYTAIEQFGIKRELIDAGEDNEISVGIAEELYEMIHQAQAVVNKS